MEKVIQANQELAASVTRHASRQTYYLLRFLADRPRLPDAFRAYAYFRWVDDRIDEVVSERSERAAFMGRQKALVESLYRGHRPGHLAIEEQLLADLILADREENSGLQSYIRNMMAAIDFDAQRRGRLISRVELATYSRYVAVSVTDVLHYFIGHGRPEPEDGPRYLSATGAHITHMLRDTLEDIQAGYFNVPREYLVANGIGPQDVESDAYQSWVQQRASLARACFKSGRDYLARVKNIRLRIVAHVYTARFETALDAIERLDYRLGREYPQIRGLARSRG